MLQLGGVADGQSECPPVALPPHPRAPLAYRSGKVLIRRQSNSSLGCSHCMWELGPLLAIDARSYCHRLGQSMRKSRPCGLWHFPTPRTGLGDGRRTGKVVASVRLCLRKVSLRDGYRLTGRVPGPSVRWNGRYAISVAIRDPTPAPRDGLRAVVHSSSQRSNSML